MKYDNMTNDNSCAKISAILACKIREASKIISVFNTRQDETRDWVHKRRDKICRLFFILNDEIYREKLYFIQKN